MKNSDLVVGSGEPNNQLLLSRPRKGGIRKKHTGIEMVFCYPNCSDLL